MALSWVHICSFWVFDGGLRSCGGLVCPLEGPVILQWIRSSSWSRKVIQYRQITISPASRPLRNDFFFWRHIPYHRARMVKIPFTRKKNASSSEGHISVKSESIFKKYERFLKLLKRSFRCDVARLSISFGSKVTKENVIKSLSRNDKKIADWGGGAGLLCHVCA